MEVVIGPALVGQNFVTDRYFQGRPSATSVPDPKDATKTIDAPYNSANSSGSNLGLSRAPGRPRNESLSAWGRTRPRNG